MGGEGHHLETNGSCMRRCYFLTSNQQILGGDIAITKCTGKSTLILFSRRQAHINLAKVSMSMLQVWPNICSQLLVIEEGDAALQARLAVPWPKVTRNSALRVEDMR
jgi:hypothetical protein